MNESRESSTPIVAMNPTNNASGASPMVAESAEPRGVLKWKLTTDPKHRALLRECLHEKLRGLRHVTATDHAVKLTTLWHHVYDLDRLAETFYGLRKDGATGVDAVDWQSYDAKLEEHLLDLAARLKRGAYQANLVRRVTIPKPGGGTRPLGILTLEDKLVQRVTATILSLVYEPMFLDWSYGFRPGRSPHDALDQVTLALETSKVNWVLDVDIRAYFDSINHAMLLTMLEHRLADTRVLRHVKKWLRAGILHEGTVQYPEAGTPQGGLCKALHKPPYAK